MKKIIICLALVTAILPAIQFNIFSCTTFCIHTSNELVFGKNYDFVIDYGLIFENKKNIEKTAFIQNGNPAKWISKYGSISFNQFGREFPSGGMNEAGLVVELMWLDDTKYPEPDDRPLVGGTLSWIQYQLDNSATIEEVIESDKKIRISQSSVPIHYLVADKNGKCISVEFLDGKLVYNESDVLTNDTYEKSSNFLKKHEGFGGNEPVTENKGSLERYVNACQLVKNYKPAEGQTAVDYGFNLLKTVDQGDYTRWSIVYDIKNLVVYFRTERHTGIKNIDLKKSDFKCAGEVKMADINNDLEGNINSKMILYNYEANRKLIEDSYSGVDFLKGISKESKDKAAKYPELLRCSDKSVIDDSRFKGKGYIGPLDLIFSPFGIALGFLVLSVAVLIKFKYKKRPGGT